MRAGACEIRRDGMLILIGMGCAFCLIVVVWACFHEARDPGLELKLRLLGVGGLWCALALAGLTLVFRRVIRLDEHGVMLVSLLNQVDIPWEQIRCISTRGFKEPKTTIISIEYEGGGIECETRDSARASRALEFIEAHWRRGTVIDRSEASGFHRLVTAFPSPMKIALYALVITILSWMLAGLLKLSGLLYATWSWRWIGVVPGLCGFMGLLSAVYVARALRAAPRRREVLSESERRERQKEEVRELAVVAAKLPLVLVAVGSFCFAVLKLFGLAFEGASWREFGYRLFRAGLLILILSPIGYIAVRVYVGRLVKRHYKGEEGGSSD